MLLCAAQYAPDLADDLREDIFKSVKSDKALKRVEKKLLADSELEALVRVLGTTQAVDLIEGGVKVNALPERATAVVNHRIAPESSVSALVSHLTSLFQPLATKYNLEFTSFGTNISSSHDNADRPFAGSLRLSDAFKSALEPAPISPTDSAAFRLLSGSILAAYNSSLSANKSSSNARKMIVAPSLVGGNTDTQFYWNLTRNIFRYSHILEGDGVNEHTVGEALRATTFVDNIRFFTTIILNADESDDL